MNTDKIFSIMADIGSAILKGLGIMCDMIAEGARIFGKWFIAWLERNDVPLFTKSKVLGMVSVSGTIFALIMLIVLVANIRSYHAFKVDKKIAVRNGRSKDSERMMRKSERHLLWLCFCGGALGGFLGMVIKQHKTKKTKFLIIVPLLTLIQLSIYSVAIGFFSFWLFFR